MKYSSGVYKKGVGPLVVIIVVAVLLVIGGGYYFMKNNDNGGDKALSEAMVQKDGESITDGLNRTSIRALLGLGQSITCSFERVDESGDMSGTVYISGEQMRGDFSINTEVTGAMTSHMIRDGEFAYIWSDSMKQGSKLKIRENNSDSNTKNDNTIDLDEEIDHDCKKWNRDNSMFDVPRDIDFIDISAMMEKQMEVGGNIKTQQCAACDSAPDASSKQQCRLALGCQ